MSYESFAAAREAFGIGRVQAIIELDLASNILGAKQKLLDAMERHDVAFFNRRVCCLELRGGVQNILNAKFRFFFQILPTLQCRHSFAWCRKASGVRKRHTFSQPSRAR